MYAKTHRKYCHLFFDEFEHNDKKYELGIFTDHNSYYITCYDRLEDMFSHLEVYHSKTETKKRVKEILKNDFKGAKEHITYNPTFVY